MRSKFKVLKTIFKRLFTGQGPYPNGPELKRPKTLVELFSDRDHWTQEMYARDAYNMNCSMTNRACQFCLVGGINFVYGPYGSNKFQEIVTRLGRYLEKTYPELPYRIDNPQAMCISFNDNATYEDVLAVVKEVGV